MIKSKYIVSFHGGGGGKQSLQVEVRKLLTENSPNKMVDKMERPILHRKFMSISDNKKIAIRQKERESNIQFIF